jgi:hypothetical protein
MTTVSEQCWELADTATGKFVDVGAYGLYMMKIIPKVQVCGPPPPTGGPTPAQKSCLEAAGTYFSLEEAQTACAADSSCTAVIGGHPRQPTVYSKFGGDATVVPLDTRGSGGTSVTGLKAYVKKPCAGSPPPSNLSVIPSPTAPAPRIISTLGAGDPSLSGMNTAYTSGIQPPSGSPWSGLKGLTEMASEVTNPAFRAQMHPNPPLGNLAPVQPDTGLFGPGPNVLRKNLVACTCASQTMSCPVHPAQR